MAACLALQALLPIIAAAWLFWLRRRGRVRRSVMWAAQVVLLAGLLVSAWAFTVLVRIAIEMEGIFQDLEFKEGQLLGGLVGATGPAALAAQVILPVLLVSTWWWHWRKPRTTASP